MHSQAQCDVWNTQCMVKLKAVFAWPWLVCIPSSKPEHSPTWAVYLMWPQKVSGNARRLKKEKGGATLCKQKCKQIFDWCCLYYFVTNLLEALCARIFLFRFVNIGFFPDIAFLSKVSNKAFFPPLSARLLCLVVTIPLVSRLYMCACVCVPLYKHVKMCR